MVEKQQSSRLLWEHVADIYNQRLEHGLDPFQEELNIPSILSLFPNKRDLNRKRLWVLDIAGGNGRFDQILHAFHPKWDIVHFDGAPSLAKLARSKNPNTPSLIADALGSYPFIDHSFDIAIAKMLFSSLSKIEPVFAEAARVIKPRGNFIISTLHEDYFPYLQRQFQKDLYFFERNLRLTQMTWSESISVQDVQKALDRFDEQRQAYHHTIWAKVSGSSFMVPVFQHTREEILENAYAHGFRLAADRLVKVTLDFAYNHSGMNNNWYDRIGMPIIENMRFIKN